MKLSPIGSNQTELTLENGVEILFSYSTPVAAFVPGRGWVRTDEFHSVTTSKHINRWIPEGAEVEKIPQADLDKLAG